MENLSRGGSGRGAVGSIFICEMGEDSGDRNIWSLKRRSHLIRFLLAIFQDCFFIVLLGST